MKKLRVGILGATGIVGQHFVKILHNHPSFELVLLTASQHSSGMQYSDATDWIASPEIPPDVSEAEVKKTDVQTILEHEIDIAFSSLPSTIASKVEGDIARAGIPVFSNAGAYRNEDTVPILIPEINPDHISLIDSQEYDHGFIITNSNCSTSGLVFGLKPLMQFGIKSVMVTTFQAVSGAGRHGVASLDILGNVLPFIANEETKLENETKKILGKLEGLKVKHADFEINASCARVPVMNGHLESVVVELEHEISVEETKDAFVQFTGEPQKLQLTSAPEKPIICCSENDRPQPKRDLDDLGMAVKIGRVRRKGARLNFFLLVHNTIRGAAGASVLNAEFALAKGHLDHLKKVIP